MSIKNEIQDEFNEYSEINIQNNYSIGHAYSQFAVSDKAGRNFGFIKKGSRLVSEYESNQHEKKVTFLQTLKEFSNENYARKLSGLGYEAAKYYIKWMNGEAEKRGMPAIFVKKEQTYEHNKSRAKLNEKQVSYIKYLVTKYSEAKVAKMYNVSSSTIHIIKRGMIWKNVKPAIIKKGEEIL